jgi:MFS family permease
MFICSSCSVSRKIYFKTVPETNLFYVLISLTRLTSTRSMPCLMVFFLVFLYKLQYSVFGSIVTIGGMVGAILSGKMADLIGRRGVISLTTLLALKI